MSTELNSKIGAQLDPMGTDTRGSEPMAGDESEGPMRQTALEVKSMFGLSGKRTTKKFIPHPPPT